MTSLKLRSLLSLLFVAFSFVSIHSARAGELLVADRVTNQVIAYHEDGSFSRILVDATGGLDTPAAMAIGFDNDLFVASNGQTGTIRRYDLATGAKKGPNDGVFATGMQGASGLYFDQATNSLLATQLGSPVLNQFNSAGTSTPHLGPVSGWLSGITKGPDDNIYVSVFQDDNGASHVVKFDRATNFDSSSDFATPAQGGAAFFTANQPVFGSDGNLYVTVLFGQTMLKFPITNDAVSGNATAQGSLPFATSLLNWGDNLLVGTLGNDNSNMGPLFSGDIQFYDIATGDFKSFISPAQSNNGAPSGFFQPTAMLLSPVPEPTSIALAGLGFSGLAFWYARKRRRA